MSTLQLGAQSSYRFLSHTYSYLVLYGLELAPWEPVVQGTTAQEGGRHEKQRKFTKLRMSRQDRHL